jgi:uncharacterized protein (DUF433 family)
MTKPWTKHLVAQRDICGRTLCARGTRIPVTAILDCLAEAASEAQILRSYPTLRSDHVRAALAYAADLAREEQVIPLASHAREARRKPSRRAHHRSA